MGGCCGSGSADPNTKGEAKEEVLQEQIKEEPPVLEKTRRPVSPNDFAVFKEKVKEIDPMNETAKVDYT